MIAEAIIAEELPAIVAMMLEGGRRLMDQGGYTVPASNEAAVRSWQLRSDPVRQWVSECTISCDYNAGEYSSELYANYREWSVRCGHKTMAKPTFGRRLNRAGFLSKHAEHGEKYALRRRVGSWTD
jgi:putative DNA primase/helicase